MLRCAALCRGIWICSDCLQEAASRSTSDTQIEDDLHSLVGKNAGAIAMALNVPHVEPIKVVIDGAIAVQESLRSPWTFVGLDADNNTIWISPDRKRTLRVDTDGNLEEQRI